jgi:muramoyltetrapeptide carboxypeptidase
MSDSRRKFLLKSGAAFAAVLPSSKIFANSPVPVAAPSALPLKPRRLRPNSTVGLITPATQVSSSEVNEAVSKLTGLGLRTKLGKHVLDQYGYLGGQDRDRAQDINDMFANPNVDAIIAVRGGWGCNRLLEYLDYDLIRQNPKIIMGYSDITSLLNAIYAQTNMVTFHGAVGTSTWNPFTKDYLQRILFDGLATTLDNRNPLNSDPPTVRTIRAGVTEGVLVGGNLSVFSAMVGSPYLPDFEGKILFIEEVSEDVYRVDRMLTQLRTAGILSKIKGFVFGNCKDCAPKMSPTLSMTDVLYDHIAPLGIPAWYGSMIGHITNKFTVPIGTRVEIDSVSGTIRMLEPAVL